MNIYKQWSTHMPVLIKAVQMSQGPVLELGSGYFSTPLLHWLCAEKNRKLVTYEDDKEFFQFAYQFRSRNHKIIFVDDWGEIDIGQSWGVALIDHQKKRRDIEALRLKDNVDYLVLHDTNNPRYHHDRVWPHFKEVYHWKFCTPWTSVVSNRKKLDIFK